MDNDIISGAGRAAIAALRLSGSANGEAEIWGEKPGEGARGEV
jgi:hypothetical protein